VPVTASLQVQDVLRLHTGHNVVIVLVPFVSGSVDPTDVVASISRSSLVCDHSDELVVSSVQAYSMLSVKLDILALDLLQLLFTLLHGASVGSGTLVLLAVNLHLA